MDKKTCKRVYLYYSFLDLVILLKH